MCQVKGFFGTVCNFKIVTYKIYGEREDEAGAELQKAIESCHKGPVLKSIEEEVQEIAARVRELELHFSVEIKAV